VADTNNGDDAELQQNKQYWQSMPDEQFRAIIREHARKNEMWLNPWRFDEYNRIWAEERKNFMQQERQENELFQLSPRQLRERDIGGALRGE
jgi:hypothetical protein